MKPITTKEPVTVQDIKVAPRVELLGTAIIEKDGPGFLVMLPNGDVSHKAEYHLAIRHIKKHFAKITPSDAIGVGQITTYDGSSFPVASRNGYITEIA